MSKIAEKLDSLKRSIELRARLDKQMENIEKQGKLKVADRSNYNEITLQTDNSYAQTIIRVMRAMRSKVDSEIRKTEERLAALGEDL